MFVLTSLAIALLSGRHNAVIAAPPAYSALARGSSDSSQFSSSWTTVPWQIFNSTSTVQTTYPGYGLDAPRVSPINSSVLDWWYFHAYSTAGDVASIAFNFYTTTPGGYPLLTNKTTALDLEIFGSLPNGTSYWANAYPSSASIMTLGDGSSGQWGEFGSWSATPQGLWTIEFDNEMDEISGTVTMQWNGAPVHLPCGAPEAGGQEQFMPHLYWSNALPDANAQVDLTYKGEKISYQGIGYHDKTWGDQSFYQSVGSWYWAQGRLGPYSLMFYDTRDQAGTEYFLSYLAKDGEIVSSTCADNSVVARPWGNGALYPPTMNTTDPLGLTVDFDVDGQNFHVNLTNIGTVTQNPAYTRWIGNAVGGFEGEEEYTGKAIYEVVKLTM